MVKVKGGCGGRGARYPKRYSRVLPRLALVILAMAGASGLGCPEDLEDPDPGNIRGQVTVSGAGRAGIPVDLLVQEESGFPIERQTTDGNGNYLFEELQPDPRYLVRITPPAGVTCPTTEQSAPVRSNEDTVVNFACTANVPTAAQIQGSYTGTRGTRTTIGTCPPALDPTWTGSMTRFSDTEVGMAGIDPQVSPIRGPYNPSNGQYTGTGSAVLANGFRVETTVTGTFSFDQTGRVVFNGTMTRRHFDPSNTLVCSETYPVTAQSTAAPSSRRFKQDVIALLPEGMSLLGLRPVAFRYAAPYGDPAIRHVGLVAEDVARVFPEAVTLDADGRPYGIRYEALTGLVIAEIGVRLQQALEAGIARLAGAP